MTFDDEPRKPPAENIVPMINVVFLLLVFFLMTATIAPPDPFDIGLPASSMPETAETDQSFYVRADGVYSFAGAEGDLALAALVETGLGQAGEAALIIRADRDVPGVTVAQLLKRLLGQGITNAQLVAEARS
ncbi:MAG: biopolymer transporter ExbD [Pseudomonadota bacterium]